MLVIHCQICTEHRIRRRDTDTSRRDAHCLIISETSIFLTDPCTPWHGVEVERLTDHCSYRVWKHHILLRIADTQGGGIKSYFSVTSRIRKTEFSYILVIKLNNQMKKLLMISIIFTLLLVVNFSMLTPCITLAIG